MTQGTHGMDQLREHARLMDIGMGVYHLVSAIECWKRFCSTTALKTNYYDFGHAVHCVAYH